MVKKKKYQTVLLHVDSRDKANLTGSTTTNFQVNLPFPVKNVCEISLASAEIPNTSYAFQEANNNLIWKEQTGSHILNFRIPVGDYSAQNLISTLANGMTAASSADGNSYTYTVSFSSFTSKLTFSATGNFQFLWNDPVTHQLCYRQIGFNPITELGYGTTHTANNNLNIAGDPYVFLDLPNLQGAHSVASNYNDYGHFFKIPMNGGNDDIISYYSGGHAIKQNIVFSQPQNISFLQVRFYSYNRTIWQNENCDLSFTLALRCLL
jgi:hypothetical protein